MLTTKHSAYIVQVGKIIFTVEAMDAILIDSLSLYQNQYYNMSAIMDLSELHLLSLQQKCLGFFRFTQ